MKIIITEQQANKLMSETTQSSYTVYHGADFLIQKFSDEFVGGENATDEQGAGIYFTTSLEEARRYGDYTYTLEVSGRFIDDQTSWKNVKVKELVALIKMAEDWEYQAYNFDTDANRGAHLAAQGAIDMSENEKDAFQYIEADFYKSRGRNYVQNMVRLGYDGMIVGQYGRVDSEHKNIIVYNPNIIKITKVVKNENNNN